MRWSQKYLAVAMEWAWFLATSAANAVVLDFAGLDAINLEHPVDYYAGGFGSLGSGPGPDYGVTFSLASIFVLRHPRAAAVRHSFRRAIR